MSVSCVLDEIEVNVVKNRVELVVRDDNPYNEDEEFGQLSPDAAIEVARNLVAAAYEAMGHPVEEVYISVGWGGHVTEVE